MNVVMSKSAVISVIYVRKKRHFSLPGSQTVKNYYRLNEILFCAHVNEIKSQMTQGERVIKCLIESVMIFHIVNEYLAAFKWCKIQSKRANSL